MDFSSPFIIAALVVGLSAFLQLLLCFFTVSALRNTSRERQLHSKEIYGMLKKMEGLTASKREQMVKHYDSILEDLSQRLPPTVAAQASELILETEGKILSRLAELEPNLRSDDDARKKMEALIRSMEKLETTLVAITADTVRHVLSDGRRSLLEEEDVKPSSLAA